VTDRIDAFAQEGLPPTNYCPESQCTPTRSALPTGRHANRSGIDSLPIGHERGWGLVSWEKTLGDVLSEADYGCSDDGKWHVGEAGGWVAGRRGLLGGVRPAAYQRRSVVADRHHGGSAHSLNHADQSFRPKAGFVLTFVVEHDIRRGTDDDQLVDGMMLGFDRNAFGLWALEIRDYGRLMGFTGRSVAALETSFPPAVEVRWRLARWAWGKGCATEAATAALNFGFSRTGIDEVVSFTSFQNIRSQLVVQRLGMTRDRAGEFEHPGIPPGHRLRPHVRYRIGRRQWTARQPTAGVADE
jgi:RimJ/RimL family protein N-acetyltransferase